MDTTAIEISERYGEAFARAFATFVRELAKDGVIGQPSAASDDRRSQKDQTLADQRVLRAGADDTSAATDFLEVTGNSAARGIAERLRRIIKARGLTQKELAEKLGVTPARISTVLKNPDRSKVDTLRKITDALGIELREML